MTISLLSTGCVYRTVDVTIVKQIRDDPEYQSFCGKMGTTVVRSPKDEVGTICGYYGEVGDKIHGFWMTGFIPYTFRGFWPK